MRNKIFIGSTAAALLSWSLVFFSCRRDVLTGTVVHETTKGLVYFPDAKNGDSSLVAPLGTKNYSIDTTANTINFPISLFRGGFSDLSSFAVNISADNSSIPGLIQAGLLPQNTIALDPDSYILSATDTLSYTDGIMKGVVMPKIKVANLGKYSGKYAALGITTKSAGKFDVNTSMNRLVIYFPVDSLVGPVYFPGATGGAASVVSLGDSYTIDSVAGTVNYPIPVKRGGIADLATSSVNVTVDNSSIAGLISGGGLPSNTVALASSDYTFDGNVAMSSQNGTLQGSAIPKISIAKLSQYAGKVVALGLTISGGPFTIDPNRNKIVVYFNADDILAIFAPRVNLIADITQWVPVKISSSNNVTATIDTQNGTILFSGGNGSYDQTGVYQQVHLYGHRQYKVDLHVTGSGATNVWFEVWLSQKKPQDGQDVATGWDPTAVQLLGLNTWTGCGVAPFDGQLATIGCTGKGSTITVPTGGTYYLTIKSGGNNLGATGITASGFSFQ
ncbi:MAG: hypothetical protein J0H74_06710 [Chitinophagaceae bacterium]|nr:hypothetical protein [Chitinophagaceae bacterium]